MLKKIIIEIVPHNDQRYATVGDWFYDKDGTIKIRVSNMGNWRYEAAVVVHELVEFLTCWSAGVKQEDVDDFDMEFEGRRELGDLSEPGDDPRAPYVRQHCFATGIERLLVSELGLAWREYEATIDAL